jgi:hypothetical protein
MDKDEALEALILKAGMNPVMQGSCYVMHPEALQAVIDEAIKQALAAPAVQEPLGFISQKQVCLIKDPEDDSGVYIPMRKTLAGNFDCPVYTTRPAHPAALPTLVTEEMHVAAVKVLHRANGVDGLPQRMMDAMLAVQSAQPALVHFAWMRYEEDCAGDPVLVFARSTEEGAFKVYKEPPAAQPAQPASEEDMKVYRAIADNYRKDFAAAQPALVQEPVAWKWHQAPVKTSWGHDMVVADLAIDKDNTVSVYCERDQKAKVEAMFAKEKNNG